MILADAGPLVALFDRTDAAHGRCIETLMKIDEPIATTVPVLTEAFHLLGSAGAGASALMNFITEGGLQVLYLDDDSIVRAFELMAQYADAPMDFADASLVALAESLSLRKVFTIDRNDFTTYRIRSGHRYIAFDVME
jgi:predicted nucleic acid-binding protein